MTPLTELTGNEKASAQKRIQLRLTLPKGRVDFTPGGTNPTVQRATQKDLTRFYDGTGGVLRLEEVNEERTRVLQGPYQEIIEYVKRKAENF